MRRFSAIMMVLTLLAASGLALAQTTPEDTQNDVSHEFKNSPPDPNGLPAVDTSVPTAILDSHAYAGGLANVPVNEWIMPEIFSDGSGGRTKDIILPGLVRFNAMYGNWQDKDGDQVILYTNDSDPANEWTFENVEPDGTNVTQGVQAYIYPGYRPDAFSDCYILGYKYLGFDFCYLSENTSDLEYSYMGEGEWRNSWGFFDDDGSLLKQIEVHTTANAVDTNTEPGYQCSDLSADGDNAPCLVDIDQYDALDQNVADLYAIVTAVANDQIDQTFDTINPIVDPVTDPIVDLAVAVANNATGLVFRDEPNEADPTGPHPSMTGVDYTDGAHAYLDIRGAAFYPVPGVITLSWQTFAAMPTGQNEYGNPGGEGFAPHVHSFMGFLHSWHDTDSDGEIDEADDYWKGICNVGVDGKSQTSFNITLEPIHPLTGAPTTWGTAGVYVLRNDGDGIEGGNTSSTEDDFGYSYVEESILDILEDGQVDQYHFSGPIVVNVGCDDSDPGDFFSNDYVVFPEGTNGFRIRATSDVLSVTFGDPFTGDSVTETVQDVDWIENWN